MKTEFIRRGGERFAVVPLGEWERLRQAQEMLADIRDYDAAKSRQDESFPSEIADRLIRGEHPVRVFRDYRGLTQARLAKMAKIARPYLAEIETGRKSGSVAVLKSLARALRVDLNDLTA
jgi:DNA-binding XRE family transcriptional regulator